MILDSPNKIQSLDFYKRLNFHIAEIDGYNFASDNKVIIRLNPDSESNAGILVFRSGVRKIVEKLSATIKIEPGEEGYVFNDPSGSRVTLIESSDPIKPLSHNQAALTGNFAGISLGLNNPVESINIWKLLGFKIVAGSPDQGWVVMTDSNDSSISIMNLGMCPHKFFNPSLSYFNGDNNLKIIDGIRKAGVDIEEEVTAFNKEGKVDNIILRDPGGIGFFIFND